jgi:hypothetical protein
MFTEMFDGLRSYYVGYESRRDAAGFHAAASLSFIACVAVASAVPLADYALNGNIDRASAFFEHKLMLLTLGVLIGYGHVLLAKRTGRYHSLDRTAPKRWKRYIAVYSAGTAILLVAATVVAIVARPSA